MPPTRGLASERAKTYGSDEIGIDDDRGLCSHASFCATKLTNAWKLAARQDLDAAARRSSPRWLTTARQER